IPVQRRHSPPSYDARPEWQLAHGWRGCDHREEGRLREPAREADRAAGCRAEHDFRVGDVRAALSLPRSQSYQILDWCKSQFVFSCLTRDCAENKRAGKLPGLRIASRRLGRSAATSSESSIFRVFRFLPFPEGKSAKFRKVRVVTLVDGSERQLDMLNHVVAARHSLGLIGRVGHKITAGKDPD